MLNSSIPAMNVKHKKDIFIIFTKSKNFNFNFHWQLIEKDQFELTKLIEMLTLFWPNYQKWFQAMKYLEALDKDQYITLKVLKLLIFKKSF